MTTNSEDNKKRKSAPQSETPSTSAAGGDGSAATDTNDNAAATKSAATNSAAAEKSVPLPDPPLDIDDECNVRWRDGNHILKAKIIERRPLNYVQTKRKKKRTKAQMSVKGLKADEIEYYIHYVKQDR